MKIRLVAINARFSHSCLALFYVRQALERHLPGCRVELCQWTINDPYYKTLLRLTADRPGAVFFSVYIWNRDYVARLVADLRRVLPRTAIVLGGPEVTFPAGAGSWPGCTVVRGGIEGVADSFYEDLLAGQLQAEYRARPDAPFSMPYRDEDFAAGLKNRNIYYESSRGCPFACSYCLSSVEPGVRSRDLAAVKEELGRILAHRPGIIRFVDRTFNVPADRALAIWRFLAGQPGRTRFHFEVAPDLFDQETLDFLATVEPGRFQFEIGIQSFNPETLAAVNRRMDFDLARRNIARLAAADNIHLHVDLILGLPFETEASFRRSFAGVFRLFPHYIQMGLLKILPGTAISREAAEYGLVARARPPYEVLATRWLDHEALARLYWFGECVEAFYNRRFFKTTLAWIRESGEDPFAFFEALARVCRRHGFFERAATRELMTGMLAELAGTRADRQVFLELLCFDWLAAGQHRLPEYLAPRSMKEIRDYLWRRLPATLPPLYSARTRSSFFKRNLFYWFSAPVLNQVGLGEGKEDGGWVCFLRDQPAGGVRSCDITFHPSLLTARLTVV